MHFFFDMTGKNEVKIAFQSHVLPHFCCWQLLGVVLLAFCKSKLGISKVCVVRMGLGAGGAAKACVVRMWPSEFV